MIEDEYVDHEYAEAYSRFYSHQFRPPPKNCVRYLFFSSEFDSESVLRHLHDAGRAEFQGFVVVWPTAPPVIGRSALAPSPNLEGYFFLAVEQAIHALGMRFVVESAPFASKDYGVSLCATIATWIATDILHDTIGSRDVSGVELTLLATGYDPKWGRPLPQHEGLDAQQIVRALTSLDLGPVVHYFGFNGSTPSRLTRTEFSEIVCTYVRSGIPVILLGESKVEDKRGPRLRSFEGRHAVTAIGFRWNPNGDMDDASRSSTVDLLIHDDRYGCFGKFVLGSNEASFEGTVSFESDRDEVEYKLDLDTAIVPLPRHVSLQGGDAISLGRKYISELADKLDRTIPTSFFARLVAGVDLKEESLDWRTELSVVSASIRGLALPRFVWVIEGFNDAFINEPIARAILDATQLRFAENRLVLAVHIEREYRLDIPSIL